MTKCKHWGATYVILTAKHHDGFCLWPTKTSIPNVGHSSGSNRDIIGEFKAAAERAGLSFGLYFSWFEFGVSITKKYLNEIVLPQINELQAYQPAIWWFDGNWEIKSKYAERCILSICEELKRQGAQINDRVTRKTSPTTELGNASFRLFQDRCILESSPGIPWESIQSIGKSWGISKYHNRYKSGSDLLSISCVFSVIICVSNLIISSLVAGYDSHMTFLNADAVVDDIDHLI
jgi:alpha-L-fucosidase